MFMAVAVAQSSTEITVLSFAYEPTLGVELNVIINKNNYEKLKCFNHLSVQ